MKYKISLSTYDPDIVAALSSLGYKKAEFIEQALGFFLNTKKGKAMMKLMTGGIPKVNHAVGRKIDVLPAAKAIKGGGAGKISIDRFLD
ncbi:MAG: hypothetical protein M0Z71_10430 [Nitrospiraceae bacterium]|nr:hypothetical protein [Nitrospiraceae bacterium]